MARKKAPPDIEQLRIRVRRLIGEEETAALERDLDRITERYEEEFYGLRDRYVAQYPAGRDQDDIEDYFEARRLDTSDAPR